MRAATIGGQTAVSIAKPDGLAGDRPVRSTAVDLDLAAHRDLAFLVNVVATGSVPGLDSAGSPEEVIERLGPEYATTSEGLGC